MKGGIRWKFYPMRVYNHSIHLRVATYLVVLRKQGRFAVNPIVALRNCMISMLRMTNTKERLYECSARSSG